MRQPNAILKIQGLTDTLTAIFPELEGDQVTFIGSSLRKHGAS